MKGQNAEVIFLPSIDLGPADWIVGSDQPWSRLVTFGPEGFAAYARLRFIPDPTYEGQSENDANAAEDLAPEFERVRIALDVLARHTATPGDCYVCLWDGWGLEFTEPSGRPVPQVNVPHRSYYLFRTSLADLRTWDHPDPAFIWPADHSWCIAKDVDPHWAGLGASARAIDDLLAIRELDVVRADPDEEQPCYR